MAARSIAADLSPSKRRGPLRWWTYRTCPYVTSSALRSDRRFVTRPVVLGPATLLMLAKLAPDPPQGGSCLARVDALLPVYEDLPGTAAKNGVGWTQLDETALALDLDEARRAAFERIRAAAAITPRADHECSRCKMHYIDPLGE